MAGCMATQGGESEGQGARHGLLSKDTYRAALQQQIEDQRAYSRHDPTMGVRASRSPPDPTVQRLLEDLQSVPRQPQAS